MFDFDAGKLLIIGVVALVVIGPKDLPRVLRQLGQMVTRVRRMAAEFQGQFMDAVKDADLQDLRSEVAKIKDSAKLDVDFDPARDVKHHLMSAVDGTGGNPVPTAAAAEMEALPSVPRASKSFPMPAVDNSPSVVAAAVAPVTELTIGAGSGGPDHSVNGLGEPAESKAPRRKIVVSRRPGPTRRDELPGRAPLRGRSRNILPARRETPDQ